MPVVLANSTYARACQTMTNKMEIPAATRAEKVSEAVASGVPARADENPEDWINEAVMVPRIIRRPERTPVPWATVQMRKSSETSASVRRLGPLRGSRGEDGTGSMVGGAARCRR